MYTNRTCERTCGSKACSRRRPYSRPALRVYFNSIVGAGLPAKAAHSVLMQTEPPLSRAGSLPQEKRVRPKSGRLSGRLARSEEHTSELQSLMRISYAVYCFKKKPKNNNTKAK